MAFEIFKRTRWKGVRAPTVTLGKSGRISFNVVAIRDFLEDHRFATLMYDRDRRLIGIQIGHDSNSTTYPIFRKTEKSCGWINGHGFLRYYSILPTNTTLYKVNFDSEAKLITFAIDEH